MTKIDTNAINSRIQLLRQEYAGDRGKSKFAQEIGISSSTYSYYEKGRVPPIDILLKISQITGVDLYWILTGTEHRDPRLSTKAGNEPLFAKINYLLSQREYLAASVEAFIDLLYEKESLEQGRDMPVQADSERPGWIPVLGRTAAGVVAFWDQQLADQKELMITELDDLVSKHIGKDITAFNDGTLAIDLQSRSLLEKVKNSAVNIIQVNCGTTDEPVEFVQSQELYDIYRDSFALRVDGDSMSPRINDGDIVILSPSVTAGEGKTAVIKLKNQIGVTCKIIRTEDRGVHLIAANEKYDTKVVPKDDVVWALAVLCHIKSK